MWICITIISCYHATGPFYSSQSGLLINNHETCQSFLKMQITVITFTDEQYWTWDLHISILQEISCTLWVLSNLWFKHVPTLAQKPTNDIIFMFNKFWRNFYNLLWLIRLFFVISIYNRKFEFLAYILYFCIRACCSFLRIKYMQTFIRGILMCKLDANILIASCIKL